MRTTFSVCFYCRASKTDKHGLAPLEASIIINQKRVFINLPSKFKPEDFNRKRKPADIEELLDAYRTKINEVMADLMRNDIPITVNTVRTYLKSGGVKSMEVCDLCTKYLSSMKKRIGTTMSQSVYRKYEITVDLVYELIGEHKEISSIVNADMVEFYDELKRRYKHSTAAGYFTKVKTLFMYAFDNGYMKINPFNGIKIDKGHPSTEYLTENELQLMANTELDGHLEKARDLLLFQGYGGGMAYCDLVAFNPKRVEEVNGVYIYTANRKKTGIEFTTVLFPKAMEILRKYDYQLPIISNQRLNSYAKEVAAACGIKKNVHSHLLRKSYASMLIQHHVPITTICKCMGHSNSVITTKIYAHLQNETVANEISAAFR